MARRTTKRDVERTRAHLELAASKLRAGGDPQIADTIDELLQPRGYRLLVVDRPAREGQNLAISVEESVRARIYAEAERTSSDLSEVLNDGIRRVLDESWVPPRIPRARRNSNLTKVNLNVPVDADLLQQLRERIPDLVESLGYRVTPPSIALAWLIEELGLEEVLHD